MNHKCSLSSSESLDLSLREIPGTYGLPFIGAIKDRWDYFYLQGEEKFFKSRIEKYNSTVFRANMPPGPFVSPDSRVIVLVDAVSFPILFDTSKVEKRNVLFGTYMPSTSFTGGYRMCSFLDPSEPKHKVIKTIVQSLLASKQPDFIPLFRASLPSMFAGLEDELRETGKVEFAPLNGTLALEFVFKLLCDGKNPSHTKLESLGPHIFMKWLFGLQAPLMTFGLPKLFNPIEDLIIHTFKLPFALFKSDYSKLYDAFYATGTSFLDSAEKLGVSREEACHNLVFLAGFNAFGGFQLWFPIMFKYVGLAGENLHRELANEIRSIVKSEGGVTLNSINKMELTESVVYEALRIQPPVPYQYGRAKQDLVVHSHEAAFLIKKDEMIFGFQPFATRDPKIFDNPDVFDGHRFVGKERKKLIKYILWSNGMGTKDPNVDDKQCPGKDLLVLLARVFLVEFFLRYDTFTIESRTVLPTTIITFLSLKKARSSI